MVKDSTILVVDVLWAEWMVRDRAERVCFSKCEPNSFVEANLIERLKFSPFRNSLAMNLEYRV